MVRCAPPVGAHWIRATAQDMLTAGRGPRTHTSPADRVMRSDTIHKKGHEIEQRHVDGMYLDSLQY